MELERGGYQQPYAGSEAKDSPIGLHLHVAIVRLLEDETFVCNFTTPRLQPPDDSLRWKLVRLSLIPVDMNNIN